jgi:hypothetical protein
VNTAFEKTLDLVLDLTEDFKDFEKILIHVGECFECGDRVVGTISGDDVKVCPGCGEPIRMDCTVDMITQGSVVMYRWTDGPMDRWTDGPMDRWTDGLKVPE